MPLDSLQRSPFGAVSEDLACGHYSHRNNKTVPSRIFRTFRRRLCLSSGAVTLPATSRPDSGRSPVLSPRRIRLRRHEHEDTLPVGKVSVTRVCLRISQLRCSMVLFERMRRQSSRGPRASQNLRTASTDRLRCLLEIRSVESLLITTALVSAASRDSIACTAFSVAVTFRRFDLGIFESTL